MTSKKYQPSRCQSELECVRRIRLALTTPGPLMGMAAAVTARPGGAASDRLLRKIATALPLFPGGEPPRDVAERQRCRCGHEPPGVAPGPPRRSYARTDVHRRAPVAGEQIGEGVEPGGQGDDEPVPGQGEDHVPCHETRQPCGGQCREGQSDHVHRCTHHDAFLSAAARRAAMAGWTAGPRRTALCGLIRLDCDRSRSMWYVTACTSASMRSGDTVVSSGIQVVNWSSSSGSTPTWWTRPCS